MKDYDDVEFPPEVEIMIREDQSEVRFNERQLPLVYNLFKNKGYVTFKIDRFGDLIVMSAYTEEDLELE